jgi:hypothetical protein
VWEGRLDDDLLPCDGPGDEPVAVRRRDDMTADIDPYSKARAGEHEELSGIVLVLALLAVLMTLVLLFS